MLLLRDLKVGCYVKSACREKRQNFISIYIFNFYLLILERERERERKGARERETLICCFTYLFIHWLILICTLTRA